jgi:hypothetical protein
VQASGSAILASVHSLPGDGLQSVLELGMQACPMALVMGGDGISVIIVVSNYY